MRYALINTAAGLVENTIDLAEFDGYAPPEGYKLVQSDTAGIGAAYVDGTFTNPVLPLEPMAWPSYQNEARFFLDKSDVQVLRAYEAGTSVGADWIAYRAALRAVISAASGDTSQPLPVAPAYP